MDQGFVQSILDTVRDPLLVLNADLRVKAASRRFFADFAASPEGVIGRRIYEIGENAWDIPALHKLLEDILYKNSHFDDFLVEHNFGGLGPRTLLLNARRVVDPAGGGAKQPPSILLAIEDVTSRRRAERDAAAGRALLEVTLRSIGDAVIATDSAERVTFMNAIAEQMTGWSSSEAVGKPLVDVFNIVNEATRVLVESPVAKALREGSVVGLANHTILIASDGTQTPIDDSAAPIHDEKGVVVGVVMVFHDISERRATEIALNVSEVRFRRLFEAARDGILLVEPRTRLITDANPFMEELLETPRSGLIGKELWQIGLLVNETESRGSFQRLLDTGYIRYEDLPLESSQGHRREVEVVANVYQEDHSPIAQFNIRDVTERKRLQNEREDLLASEQAARTEAEAANRAKDVFLANLSHELRTPLNAILGWSVMLRASGKCPDGDVAQGLEVIERNARVQGKLIEDVLDVARIVSGKFRIDARPCDLQAVIGAAMDAVRHAADAKGVSVELRTDSEAGHLVADAVRLQQVFWNLLSNAVKFTPRGGRILIRLGRSGSLARVMISDTGKGISPQFLPHVFDRFKQADEGTTRVYGGLGLGLSLVRHIVELHGGTVRAQSDGEGRGSTFTIELPVGVEPGPQRPPAVRDVHETIPRLDGIRVLVVLVVDDEEDARTLLQKTLEAAGSEVIVAGSAADAFRLAIERRPDVLISDIGMPTEDGYSLIRRIRAEGVSPKDMPAVALSAFAGAVDKRRALLAGFQIHVAKPVDPSELIAVVASLTGRTGI